MGVARSSSENAICYVLLVLWTTSCLTVISQEKALPNMTYTQSDSPGGKTGVEV